LLAIQILCIHCKQPLSNETEKANAKRLLQEMDLQVKESKSLLEEKERKRANFSGELPMHIVKRLAICKSNWICQLRIPKQQEMKDWTIY
jgi:hypothetical protein